MTRKQIVLVIAVNAAISTIISVVVAVLIGRSGLVASRVMARVTETALASMTGNPDANSETISPDAEPDTSSPVIHTVQSGDTLLALAIQYGVSVDDITTANALDNPDAIQVGMELTIPIGGLPEASATPPPAPTPSSTPTMPFEPPSVQTAQAVARASGTPGPTSVATAARPRIEITEIIKPGDIEQEGVVLTNTGAGVASLNNWTLSDSGANVYTLARITLWPGGSITVYTRVGEDSADSVYWGKAVAIWSLNETATLKDAEGNTTATYVAGQ